MRSNGSVIGKRNAPALLSAGGVWSPQALHLARTANEWPVAEGDGTTWNPADKGTNIVLSNNNRTAANSSTWNAVRAVLSKSSGKWYFEVRADVVGGSGYVMAGVGKSTATLSNYLGSDANGWSYQSNALRWNNAAQASYGATWTAGDVIGVKLDLDAGTLEFLKNNVSQGQAYSGLSGTFFPMVAVHTNSQLTSGLKSGTLTYGVPSGYSVWV